jgi:hypothetical protein
MKEIKKITKILLLTLLLGIFVFASFVFALTTNQIFYDNLETNNFATIWTNDANNKFSRSTGVVYARNYSILADGGIADAKLTLTNGLNISNQTTCNLTAVMRIQNTFGNGEYLCMDYSTDNGVTWNRDAGSDGAADGVCQDGNLDIENAWRNVSYSFSSSGINSFKIRFRINTNAATKDGYVDNINLTCNSDSAPVISNITSSHSLIKGGNTIAFYANTSEHRVNDTEQGSLSLYCDETNTPTSANTDCTGGTTSDANYPYILSCTFATALDNANHTEFCRVYDGSSYSSAVNVTYRTDSLAPSLSLTSIAYDSSAPYFDNVSDGRTDVIFSGEANMVCRWSSSDVTYSSMSNACSISGSNGNCSIDDASQGLVSRYVSCSDSLGNENNASNNLDINFYLDYTAPTTSDNSALSSQVPNYTVTITESDNVDSDPLTYYCTSTTAGCSPTTLIDNGGVITYTSSNRGTNYLRYYSIDDAGNTQVIVNKTILINQLPVFTSASDNAGTIKGGTLVNVSTLAYDLDSSQDMTLFVCSSAGATSSGCSSGSYCNATSSGNMSCTFTSELDSSSHNWYAYIFDDLGENASNNPLTGSYTTDYTNPSITLTTPSNNSNITQNSVTVSINVNEALTNAWYSLDSGLNNISMANSSLYIYSHANTSIADRIYNLSIWANDSVGNIGSLLGNNFRIITTAPDTTAPVITIYSPFNASYFISNSVLINISSDETLGWAGYILNSNPLANLGNYSSYNWNITLTSLSEGQYNWTIFANDTSNNMANKTNVFYIDLNNPAVNWFSCIDVNDSQDVICYYNVSDAIGLNYLKIGWNATGSWQNSSSISLSGSSVNSSFTIASGNTTPGVFQAQVYLYDLSGRGNLTSYDNVNIYDDTAPRIDNIVYSPNTTALLDPGVIVRVNATIVEDYNISSVVLMWLNVSDGIWNSVNMNNNSALNTSGAMNIVYNASFSAVANGTYYFKINATDSAGNYNISNIYILNIQNEDSYSNSTSIADITTYTYTQRAENNSLGLVFINNTGDSQLNITLNITSSIRARFNINYTNQPNMSITLNSRENASFLILINTTLLEDFLYGYNISVLSSIGDSIFAKNLNVEAVSAPLLYISYDSMPTNVTRGDSSVTYIARITNFGTTDSIAYNVTLNWSLPSGFSLVSGNLSRTFSSLAWSEYGLNSIIISSSSSITAGSLELITYASASNANSANDTKNITISNPLVVSNVVTTSGSSGGGGSGAMSKSETYSRTVEIVRGVKDSFEIEITGRYYNTTLKDLTLYLSGLPAGYFTITPDKINSISYGETKSFIVNLNTPNYTGYEEHALKAVIKGVLTNGVDEQSYSQTQNIKLIIEEISRENTLKILSDAEKAIEEMKNKGFNIVDAEKMLQNANVALDASDNKAAYDLARAIIAVRNLAFKVQGMISDLKLALVDPSEVGKNLTLEERSKITGNAVFASAAIQNMLDMAISAFERGDYNLAEQRIKSAQTLLALERKGNLLLFVYLYWHYILLAVFILGVCGRIAYKKYQKRSIIDRIIDLNRDETRIRQLIIGLQEKYFTGKISAGEYHSAMSQYNSKIANLREKRLNLRNKRVKVLAPEQIIKELDSEKNQTEREIIKLQEDFYKNNKITEAEYKTQFDILNERLAEIEDDRLTNNLLHKKGESIVKPVEIIVKKSGLNIKQSTLKIPEVKTNKKLSFFANIKSYFRGFGRRKDEKLKEEINKLLAKKKGEINIL